MFYKQDMLTFSPITLGKRLTRIETNGFVLTETKHQPNLSLDRHSHRNMNLVCVLRGSFTETIGRKNFECLPQNLLLKPAGEFHSNHYQKAGAHCLIIEIAPEKTVYFPAKVLDEVKHIQTAENFSLIQRIYRELGIADAVSKMAVEGLTLELLACITRQNENSIEPLKSQILKDAKDFIHSNFNSQIGLSTIAENVGVHPSHLARTFRRRFHCSVGDYIRQLRLEYAAHQLIETGKTLAEISAEAGFYDQSHFSNAFKIYTGSTPNEYRAALK